MKSRKWPSTAGIVRKIKISRYSSGGAPRNTEFYYPEILYEYRINGEVFAGKRFQFGRLLSFSSQGECKRFLNCFTPGKKVEVFYNPEKPADAVLIRDCQAGCLPLAAIAGGGLVLCIVVIVVIQIMAPGKRTAMEGEEASQNVHGGDV